MKLKMLIVFVLLTRGEMHKNMRKYHVRSWSKQYSVIETYLIVIKLDSAKVKKKQSHCSYYRWAFLSEV